MQAVVFGAGAVGLGFMGDLLTQSGARITFYEVNSSLAQALDRAGSYTYYPAGLEKLWPERISGYRVLDGGDSSCRGALAEALAGADLIITAAGARALPALGGLIAATAEGAPPDRPRPVLCCENHRDAAGLLREALQEALGAEAARRRFACANTIVARMCQLLPPAERDLEPLAPGLDLALLVEDYAPFPVDAGALGEPLPALRHLQPIPGAHFPAHEHRKLYAHNGVHALLAVLGCRRGYEYFHQAGADTELDALGRRAMWEEVGAALLRAHPEVFTAAEMEAFARNLYTRLVNPVFGDRLERGVRDTLRMIRPEDGRLSTAAVFVAAQGLEPRAMCRGVAAALLDNDLDLSGLEPALADAPASAAETVRELTAAGFRSLSEGRS